MPGEGALNAGYAVDYGADHGEKMKLAAYFQQQHDAQQEREAAKAQAAQVHKDALAKYYGDQFDPSKFDSHTELNDQINSYLQKGHQDISQAIQDGQDGPDLERLMQQSINPALQLYQKGSLIKANLDQSRAAHKDDKSMDSDNVYKAATLNALYDKGDNGKYTIKKDISQVDPNKDYFKEILDTHPEVAANGLPDFSSTFAKLPSVSNDNQVGYYDDNNVKQKGKNVATYFPDIQKLLHNADGTVKVVPNDYPINAKDDKGNPVQIHQVSDAVISHMERTPGDKAQMDVATMKYAKEKGYPEVALNSQAFSQIKKEMVYNEASTRVPKSIKSVQDEQKTGFQIRLEAGYPPGAAGTQPIAQEAPSFNKISDAPVYVNLAGANVKMGEIKDGKVTGNIPMGEAEVKMDMDKLPEQYRRIAKVVSADNDISGDVNQDRKKTKTGFVTIKLYDKEIVGIKTDKGNWMTKDDVGAAWQKENNATVPMKAKTHPHEAKQKISW